MKALLISLGVAGLGASAFFGLKKLRKNKEAKANHNNEEKVVVEPIIEVGLTIHRSRLSRIKQRVNNAIKALRTEPGLTASPVN